MCVCVWGGGGDENFGPASKTVWAALDQCTNEHFTAADCNEIPVLKRGIRLPKSDFECMENGKRVFQILFTANHNTRFKC